MNRPTYLSLFVLSGLIGLALVLGPTPPMLDFHANLADVSSMGQSTGTLAFLFPGAAWGASKCRGEGKHCSDNPSRGPQCCEGFICDSETSRCVLDIDIEPGPNQVLCFCQDGSQINFCATVDCDSGIALDEFCGPVCQSHKGIFATGCIPNEPSCTGQ
jgi:hypothetical protein